jgi:sugar/nucleoside kinase (ribokinase family)
MSASLICSGGGATNSSVAFSRLGLKTSCLSLLGDDPLSLYVFKDLKDNQVNTDNLIHQKNEVTDYSVILVGSDGSRSIITNRGTTFLKSEHFNWDKLLSTTWLYITSLEGNMDLLEQLIGFASEHQIKISLNPGNRELTRANRLIPLLSYVDFLLLNKTESETLTELSIDDKNYWAKLLSYGAKYVGITNGRAGAHILTAEEKLFSPIINTNPIDETGAGDSFGSAFIGGLIQKLTPSEALFWAIKNSASVVSQLGAKPGLLSLLQIK